MTLPRSDACFPESLEGGLHGSAFSVWYHAASMKMYLKKGGAFYMSKIQVGIPAK